MKKLYVKLVLSIIVVISLGFPQFAEKEGNLIKLDDGRVIEVDLQTLENYFFFEVDNPDTSSIEPILRESQEYQSGFETTNKEDSNDKNEVSNSFFNLPEQRSLNESATNLYNILNSEKTYDSSPTRKSKTRISPSQINFKDHNYLLNRSQLNFSLKSFRDDHLLAKFDTLGERHYTPIVLYNQSLRTPNNNSERGKFKSKTSRKNIAPSDSPQNFDPDLTEDSSLDDTYSPFKVPDNNLPEDNIIQNKKTSDSTTVNTPLSLSNNLHNANDINNQITINLYNLTNLLDQLFAPKNQQKKKEELRTSEWENTYKKILEKDALSLFNNSNNSINQDTRFKEFIINLPIFYNLIYGENRIIPPNKTNYTEPFDAKKDEEQSYDKSVDLLENILKTFPDINNHNVQVVVVSNFITTDINTAKTNNQKNIQALYDKNDIDQRYQREADMFRKKYNYNIGLELVQIKKLFSQQQYTLVLKKLHQLEKVEPYNTRIKNIIGSTYYKIGFNEFAQSYWEESLNLDPNQPLVEAFLNRIREYEDNPSTDIPAEQ